MKSLSFLKDVQTILSLTALMFALGIGGNALAAGGTAKRPANVVSPWITPTLPYPLFSQDPALIHGFDLTVQP